MVFQIDTIDTEDQAKVFAERLSGPSQIYFLDGVWGSGKSEYLKKVASFLPKNFKFVQLALWKPSNKATLAKKIFLATNPCLAVLSTLLGWVLICVMVVGSVILAYESVAPPSNKSNIPLRVTAIAVIATTLYGFLKDKWLDVDRIRMAISSWSLRNTKKHKILVVDDFDRLEEKTQTELYMFFNSIRTTPSGLVGKCQEPARVIFVGDLRKLKNNKDNYLRKIIDQKIVLPFSLQSQTVAHYMVAKIQSKVKCDCSAIQGIFTIENRTPRDANLFLAYVKREVIEQQKVGKVQLDQELLVIYLYIFHPDKYQMLLDGWLPKSEEGKPENNLIAGDMKEKDQDDTPVTKLMRLLFRPRASNPPDFSKNTSAYFVNELATNHSLFELREIINSNSYILKELLDATESGKGSEYEEFCYFIENMSEEEYSSAQHRLEESVMSVMRSEVRHQPNSLIRLIFKKRSDSVCKGKGNINNTTCIEKFDKIFDDAGIAESTERMYYYRACLDLYGDLQYGNGVITRSIPAINVDSVMAHFSEKAKSIEKRSDFGKRDYDAEALIVQLGYSYYLDGPINPHVNPDFQSKVESIEKLKPSEYQAFWRVYDIQILKDNRTGMSDNIKLTGSKALEFGYKGQLYSVSVLKRLAEYI